MAPVIKTKNSNISLEPKHFKDLISFWWFSENVYLYKILKHAICSFMVTNVLCTCRHKYLRGSIKGDMCT